MKPFDSATRVGIFILVSVQLFVFYTHINGMKLAVPVDTDHPPVVHSTYAMEIIEMNSGVEESKFDAAGDVQDYFDVDKARSRLALERNGQANRVIAMSLFGESADYISGALANAMIMKEEWDSSWHLRVYYDDTVPLHWIQALHDLDVQLVYIQNQNMDKSYLFWRYFVIEDPSVTRFIIRDSDSRITSRDRACVEEWVESDYLFHSIRDHFQHNIPIMGGMWGSVGGLIRPELMTAYRSVYVETVHDDDQKFLAATVWPSVKSYTLSHDSFTCMRGDLACAETRPLPVQRKSREDYVGSALRFKDGRLVCIYGAIDAAECPVQCRPQNHIDWTLC